MRDSNHIAITNKAGASRLVLIFALWFAMGLYSKVVAQEQPYGDEVPIDLTHEFIGSTGTLAIISGDTIFLRPVDVFNFIKVKVETSTDGKSLSGYYIDERRNYLIDFAKGEIEFKGNTKKLKPKEWLTKESGYYLRLDLFESIFNLKGVFDFSSLSITFHSDESLPAESMAKADENLKNAYSGGNEKFVAERTFGLRRSVFSLGALDYSAGASYTGNFISNYVDSNKAYNYSLTLGGQLLGGDFDASITGSNLQKKIDWDKSPWQWRFGIPNSRIVSEIIIGRRATFSNISLPDSMVGIQLSNVNKNYRSSFSTYTISDYTEPNWRVELYINDGLVNYVTADQTGYYKFTIPLSYGSTDVKLKFRGPFGEVRTKTSQFIIPYTFLPPGEVEYTLTGGTSYLHPTDLNTTMGKLNLKVGINSWLSLSGGVKYLHDAAFQPTFLPFGSTSIRVSSGILLGGEYYYGSGIRSLLNISGPFGFSLSGEYDQSMIQPGRPNDMLITDQRTIQISSPLPFIYGNFRLVATEIPIDGDSANIGISPQVMFQLSNFSFDLSTNLNFKRRGFAFEYTNGGSGSIGASFDMFGIMVRASSNVDYIKKTIGDLSVILSKTFNEYGTASITTSHSFVTNDYRVQADYRMNLPFAAFGIASGGGTTGDPQTSVTMQGSATFDPQINSLHFSDRPQVRRGGIDIIAFLDTNNNGHFDEGEPKVKKFGLEQSPGAMRELGDGTLTISELDPYHQYNLKTSTNEVENISWVPKFQTFSVNPPANGSVVIEIPMSIAGQIEGYVNFLRDKKEEALGGARIMIQNREPDDTSMVKLTEDLLTYSTGEFYYLGIQPGHYRAFVDPKQLQLLHYACDPPFIDFELKSKEEGDIIEGLNFVLKPDAMGEEVSAPRAVK